MPGDGTDTTLALISLADAKEQLKETTDDENTKIANLINQISTACNTFCERHLLSKALIEYYDGDGKGILYLKRFPIITLTKLYNANSLRVFDSDSEIDVSADAIVDNVRGIIRLWNNESAFYKGKANIKIQYTAGYALADVPDDIQRAVRLWVAYAYKQLKMGRYGVSSESIGDKNTVYTTKNMPDDVKELLAPYKKSDYGFSNFSHSEAVS